MRAVRVDEYAARIEIPTQRRLLSSLSGMHGGTGPGPSHEFLDMADYRPGDSATDIDWKASAKCAKPVIKRMERTAVLNVVVAIDTGSNMAALANADQKKKEIASEALGAISWLTARRGDHLALAVGNAAGTSMLPARSGAKHANACLEMAATASSKGAGPDFQSVLRRVDASVMPRSLLVLITDEQQLDSMQAPYLKRLAMRHLACVVSVSDVDLAKVDGAEVADAQAGPVPEFARYVEDVASDWARVQMARRQRVTQMLGRLRVPWVEASSVEGMPLALADLFRRCDRGR